MKNELETITQASLGFFFKQHFDKDDQFNLYNVESVKNNIEIFCNCV